MKENKYWYQYIIKECVLCGAGKTTKYRVYTKPNPEKKYDFIQFVCDTHFI